MIETHSFEVGGKTISIETGRIARQAGGAVLLGMDSTVILGTATMSREAREGIDFLPLVCDFEERKYAIGKIPGGFMKRGGRPSDKAILVSRLIDRPIRPLFPKGMRNDVQVITMAFSVDKNCPPDVLAINAAGAALAISDVPFNGPIAGVRVGHIDGKFVLFPSLKELEGSSLDLVVAGHKGAISMVEAGANEVSEELMVEALKVAHKAIVQICNEFEKFAKKVGKPKREPIIAKADDKLAEEIKKKEAKFIAANIFDPDKAKRESAMDDLAKELVAKYKEKSADPDSAKLVPMAVDKAIKDILRKSVIEDGKRPDGRGPTDIRSLEAVAGILPRVHGSGLFTRGQTQVMSVLTMGMPKDAQMMDTLDEEETDKRFMHFYNFPPYSVGEVRMLRGAGRREVGHGALAERALRPVVPLDDPDFPYTLHVVSDVMESNGSTSMASVCGTTLALMDAGVPIKAPVAGIAMGLMSDGKTFRVLTDIQGVEDFSGDMDFKVAGTRDGITALQLDTKLDGIPDKVLADALAQAKDARMEILDVIEKELPAPRPELSRNAPRVTVVQIDPAKIGALIGPGGANIRKITEVSGAEIDVQQDGRVLVAATDGTSAETAISMVKASTLSMEVGMEFAGTVTRIIGRGALVELPAGKDGMVPTDQLTKARIRRPDDVVSVGDVLNVRVIEIDSQGRVNLTALGLNPDNALLNDPNPPERPGNFGGGGGGRDRDRDRDRGRGGRDRDRDRGGYGRNDRGSRAVVEADESRPSASFRDRDERTEPAPPAPAREDEVPDVPDAFPNRKREDGNPRFRPRR
ncbi:MAG: polyribonucleotide nucleotidyltransferase [Fimbriimonadaceae bacterium]|nr:polyribonucleotide nucleotidyltransferase [Fimbriimonadaceae bacterium]QYK58524.1 MAG: polyribonucleotide nucleotidyltransferase [Fimbriimonadaceae bacterium]